MRLQAAILILFLCQAQASADAVFAFGEGKGEVSPTEAFFHPLKDFSYTESWFFLARLDQGYILYATIFITNMGLSRFSPGVEFSIFTPEGERLAVKKEYKKSNLSALSDKYYVEVEKNLVEGLHPDYHLHLEENGIIVDLSFKSLHPMWRMGDGKIYFGEDRKKFWSFVVPCPSALVSGVIDTGGKRVEVKGVGYHDHSLLNIPATSFSKEWHNIHIFSEDVTVNILDMVLTGKYGGKNTGFAAAFFSEGSICQSKKYVVSTGEPVADKEFGYSYPMRIDFGLEGADCSLKGVLLGKKLIEKMDILSNLHPISRGFVKTFIANPVYYRVLSDFEMEYPAQKGSSALRGKALYEIIFIKH